MEQQFAPGDVVHVIIRNPHVQDVAHVQQAAVVQDPHHPQRLSLFIHDTYYPLTDEVAVFKTNAEAEQAYQEAFGNMEMDDLHG